MATEQEIKGIYEVADKYADYFNSWNADILIGRKGPHFFYTYNDECKYIEVFHSFTTAEELETLIIGTIAENLECMNAVGAEDLNMMFERCDMSEKCDEYDARYHIAKLGQQLEVMNREQEHWAKMMTETYRALAHICKEFEAKG
jgi:hypothetical protein